jgi:putative ABC transport system permease protein
LVWGEPLIQNARYAIRRLRRDRGFAAAVIVTLGVAMGMNTAIFSVFNAVVLRPLAYPDPDRLVWLSTVRARRNRAPSSGPILSNGAIE